MIDERLVAWYVKPFAILMPPNVHRWLYRRALTWPNMRTQYPSGGHILPLTCSSNWSSSTCCVIRAGLEKEGGGWSKRGTRQTFQQGELFGAYPLPKAWVKRYRKWIGCQRYVSALKSLIQRSWLYGQMGSEAPFPGASRPKLGKYQREIRDKPGAPWWAIRTGFYFR